MHHIVGEPSRTETTRSPTRFLPEALSYRKRETVRPAALAAPPIEKTPFAEGGLARALVSKAGATRRWRRPPW